MDATNRYKSERKDVAHFMRRLYKHGLTTTSGGNISLRLSDEIIAITPSGTDKGRIRWKEVGIVSMAGENLTPELKPSIELEMHLSIYRVKSKINAIVHAHPVFASLFTAIKAKINTNLIAEARTVVGEPLLVKYAIMGSRALASVAADNILKSDILLLENHGIVTAGSNLVEAYDKMEVLENAAKMTLMTEMTGKKKPLDKARILELEKLFK